MSFLSQDLIWWITVVDLPALTGLFLLIWKTRKDSETTAQDLRGNLELRSNQLREALSAFRLEVAKGYAAFSDLKDLELRIVAHLLRIESKLDETALKTEALRGGNDNKNNNHKK